MTSVVLALPLVMVGLTQGPHASAPLRQQRPATVDLSPSTPLTTAPAQNNDKPFDKLFNKSLPPQAMPSGQPAKNQQAGPKVVCGMVVIPADPAIDPKIVTPPPPDAADAKIRRIVPDVCVDSARR
jgi:hypothetical protein